MLPDAEQMLEQPTPPSDVKQNQRGKGGNHAGDGRGQLKDLITRSERVWIFYQWLRTSGVHQVFPSLGDTSKCKSGIFRGTRYPQLRLGLANPERFNLTNNSRLKDCRLS